jgi:LuxR family transcriptional regulator, maltose regulon positive regulatory protein
MLLTKLHIPSVGNNLVRRSELYEKLNTGLSRKLILISAPAGFGKTTVLSDWIDQNKIPAAWFSIDNGDNDPVEFLRYIISGIQSIHKEFGESALKLLNSPNNPSCESVASLLINEVLNITLNFLLVLDDFHLIKSNEVLNLITYLLEHLPDNIHIVILTRSDPALSISRLRSQQQLVELRSSDLSFSANDISILFNKKLKLGLSTEDIFSLETKTEGWIAGLQLTALSMQGREDVSEFIQDLKGDNRYIMDYLVEEVLKIQLDDIKEFLIQTSILKQMSASLCNTVLNRNDSQLVLEKLDRNNMFVIQLDDERKWYRYHHLFAELLKQRLQLHDKATIYKLHNKACDWFEQNNMFNFALEHALEIKNYEKCIQLLGQVAENMWQNGMHSAILKYGDMLPVELIETNPEFCLYYSWILIAAGKVHKAEPLLASAENITTELIKNINSTREEIQYNKKLLGKIAVAFTYLNSHLEHSQKIFDYCKTAMDNLSEDDPLWFSWAWFSFGIAYFSNGDLLESNNAYNNAFEYGKKSANFYLISTIAIRMAENEQQLGHYKSAYKKCSDLLTLMKDKGYSEIARSEWTYAALYLIMGVSQLMWADMDRAYENLKIAYELCKSGRDIYLKIFILMVYTIVLKDRGDNGLKNKIDEMDSIFKQNDVPPFLISSYIGWKIYLLMENNQIDAANKIVSEYGLGTGNKKTHANEGAYSAYIRLLLAQNKLDEADLILSELYALADNYNAIEKIIELKISYAVLFKLRGNQEKAIAYLIESMEFASDENLIYYFVNDHDRLKDLMKETFKVLATIKTNISNKFVENLKLALERKEKRKKMNFGIDLSAREMDTLRLVALDLPNQEIADKLFISLNTVKTHIKNIYLKLEVDNRAKAVAKAKELGFI